MLSTNSHRRSRLSNTVAPPDLEFSLDEISSELDKLGVRETSPSRLAAIKAELDQLIARDLQLSPTSNDADNWRQCSASTSSEDTLTEAAKDDNVNNHNTIGSVNSGDSSRHRAHGPIQPSDIISSPEEEGDSWTSETSVRALLDASSSVYCSDLEEDEVDMKRYFDGDDDDGDEEEEVEDGNQSDGCAAASANAPPTRAVPRNFRSKKSRDIVAEDEKLYKFGTLPSVKITTMPDESEASRVSEPHSSGQQKRLKVPPATFHRRRGRRKAQKPRNGSGNSTASLIPTVPPSRSCTSGENTSQTSELSSSDYEPATKDRFANLFVPCGSSRSSSSDQDSSATSPVSLLTPNSEALSSFPSSTPSIPSFTTTNLYANRPPPSPSNPPARLTIHIPNVDHSSRRRARGRRGGSGKAKLTWTDQANQKAPERPKNQSELHADVAVTESLSAVGRRQRNSGGGGRGATTAVRLRHSTVASQLCLPHRQDPVTLWRMYSHQWSKQSRVLDQEERSLRWSVKAAMMVKEVPVLPSSARSQTVGQRDGSAMNRDQPSGRRPVSSSHVLRY